MNLDARKREILAIIVEEYIKTGEPVGSKIVAEHFKNGVSSATIRNEMSVLSTEGFLLQPHTSAGRIPSNDGYHYYIANLMPKKHIPSKEKDRIRAVFLEQGRESRDSLESFVKLASESLATTTNYAGIATTPEVTEGHYASIDFLRPSERAVLVLFVTSFGVALHELCRLEKKIPERTLGQLRTQINHILSEIPLEDISTRSFKVLGADFAAYYELFELIALLAKRALGGDVILVQEMNLLSYKELSAHYADVLTLLKNDSLKDLVVSGDDRTLVVDLQNTDINNQPQIGIITARYRVRDDVFGTLGVIGPARINYSKMIPYVEYVAKLMGDLMNEFFDEES